MRNSAVSTEFKGIDLLRRMQDTSQKLAHKNLSDLDNEETNWLSIELTKKLQGLKLNGNEYKFNPHYIKFNTRNIKSLTDGNDKEFIIYRKRRNENGIDKLYSEKLKMSLGNNGDLVFSNSEGNIPFFQTYSLNEIISGKNISKKVTNIVSTIPQKFSESENNGQLSIGTNVRGKMDFDSVHENNEISLGLSNEMENHIVEEKAKYIKERRQNAKKLNKKKPIEEKTQEEIADEGKTLYWIKDALARVSEKSGNTEGEKSRGGGNGGSILPIQDTNYGEQSDNGIGEDIRQDKLEEGKNYSKASSSGELISYGTLQISEEDLKKSYREIWASIAKTKKPKENWFKRKFPKLFAQGKKESGNKENNGSFEKAPKVIKGYENIPAPKVGEVLLGGEKLEGKSFSESENLTVANLTEGIISEKRIPKPISNRRKTFQNFVRSIFLLGQLSGEVPASSDNIPNPTKITVPGSVNGGESSTPPIPLIPQTLLPKDLQDPLDPDLSNSNDLGQPYIFNVPKTPEQLTKPLGKVSEINIESIKIGGNIKTLFMALSVLQGYGNDPFKLTQSQITELNNLSKEIAKQHLLTNVWYENNTKLFVLVQPGDILEKNTDKDGNINFKLVKA